MDLSIGEMARLTGLLVKTIRYYSDIGLVPEVGRTPPATVVTTVRVWLASSWSTPSVNSA